jgi:hypothetical protein
MESQLNKSFVPLQPNRSFIGQFDDVAEYSSAVISLIADTNCTITMYQSQNKTLEYTTAYNTTANTQFEQAVDLTAPFVYFTVRNESSSVTQTFLNFTVIYKTAYAVPSGGAGTDVNIRDSAGNTITATSGSLQTKLMAIDSSLTTGGALKVNVENASLPISSSRVQTLAWSSAPVADGGTSSIINMSASNLQVLSVYGTTDDVGTITVLFSAEGTVFYDSQYSYDVAVAGAFGFTIPAAVSYARLRWTTLSTPATITAYLEAC